MNQKVNDATIIFLVDDKIIKNTNIVNNLNSNKILIMINIIYYI